MDAEIFAKLFGSLGIIGFLIFTLLCIILPVSAYSAQKYAYKCFKELKKLNENIEAVLKKAM